ncbi:MAG TPA: glycosyltransferase domain-containing protein [Myxococcota bacterium]
MSVVVYTSIYGAYDPLRAHPDHAGVDRWVCFTDDPAVACPGWDVVVEPARHRHPRMAAKWHKTHPPADADVSLWVDGSLSFTAEFVDVLVESLERGDLGLWRHPSRSSIVDEAHVSARMRKYHGLPVVEQAEHYIAAGHDDHDLWAGTVLARRHTPQIAELGEAWWAECVAWTYQDQISLPPLLARAQIAPAELPASLWDNPWITINPHRSRR